MSGLLDEPPVLGTARVEFERARGPRHWPIPWIAFIVSCLFLDAMIFPMIRWLQSSGIRQVQEHCIIMGLGCFSAQACLMAVLGGLLGRSWISGYLMATGLGIVGVSLMMGGESLGMYLSYGADWDWKSMVMPALTAPIVILAISIPTLCFRVFFGWRLTRETRYQNALPSRLNIEELFIGTAVTAATLMLLRAAQEVGQIQSNQFWIPVAIVCSVLAAASLVIVVPTLWVAFRIERSGLRLLMLVGLAVSASLLVMASLILITLIMERSGTGSGSTVFEAAYYSACWMIAASTTFLLGLSLLRLSGFRLSRRDKASDAELSRLKADASGHPKQHRRLAIATFLGAFALNLGITGFLSVRDQKEEQLWQLHHNLSQRGGNVGWGPQQKVIGLTLGRNATSADLQQATQFGKLIKLSLADGQFMDADLQLLKSFPNLQSLDLKGTELTDIGLASIHELDRLEELSLAKTRVTIEGIVDLLNHQPIMKLDVSELGLNDADLQLLAEAQNSLSHPLVSIALGGNPVSGDAVQNLLLLKPNIRELDLTDCDLDEQCLSQARGRSFNRLRLDGTNISDAAMGRLLPTLTVATLSMNRTQISDAILPALATSIGITGLELGETLITEKGLANCGIQNLNRLFLNSPKFDGSCFKTWQPLALPFLDLSHSSVSDETLSHIVKIGGLGQLNLSYTGITDAALPTLRRSAAFWIDLTATQVTAAGLIDSGLVSKTISVGADQFSFRELKQIRKKLRIELGGLKPP